MAFLNTKKRVTGTLWHLELPENTSHPSLHLKHEIHLGLVLLKEQSGKFLFIPDAFRSPTQLSLHF